jgi:hypothetical protein
MKRFFIILLLSSTILFADSVSLTWVPSPDPRMNTLTPAGYMLVWGPSSAIYNQGLSFGNVTNGVISGLVPGSTNYINIFAFAGNLQSDYDGEVVYVVPNVSVKGASNLRVIDYK